MNLTPPATALLPALRRYLSLTQPRMAELLGVSRVVLAAAELGTRRLPTAGAEQLAALLAALPVPITAALAQNQVPAPPATGTPPPPDPDVLTRRRHKLRQEVSRLDAELAAHLTNAARGQARLALLAAPNPPNLGSGQDFFEQEARQWTDSLARAEQAVLVARLAGLQREMSLLDAG